MAKYMVIGTYTSEGAQGVLKEGGTARRDAARAAVDAVGGTLEAFYFGFGTDDYYLIADLPDHAAAAAVSMTVGAGGTSRSRTVVLLAPEEVDAARERSAGLRRPGT